VVAEQLYPERRVLAFEIRNTANKARVAQEYAVFSDNVDARGLGAPLAGRGAYWLDREAA